MSKKEVEMKAGTNVHFHTKKSLGQNFLKDPAALLAIVEGAEIGPEDLVIEIGPGQGALSELILPRCKKLIMIELDRELVAYLKAAFIMHENAEIIHADILKVDLNELIRRELDSTEGDSAAAQGNSVIANDTTHGNSEEAKIPEKQAKAHRVHVIGNLPYYITTPIILKLLRETSGIDEVTIMMQKEVAERLEAEPGSKAYGAISLAVQYFAEVRGIIDVPRTSFRPEPKVDSRVLRLDIRDEKPVMVTDEGPFFDCIRAGFSQRRKTLLNALSSGLSLEKGEAERLLYDAGIEPSRRAETLSMEEFARLSDCLAERVQAK